MKKRKVYKVTVKVEYVITMDHTQTSMEKAKADVKRVVDDYLYNKDNKLNILDLVDDIAPQTMYKVEIKKNERR